LLKGGRGERKGRRTPTAVRGKWKGEVKKIEGTISAFFPAKMNAWGR